MKSTENGQNDHNLQGRLQSHKKHQSTIQMHRTCTQHHPKHMKKRKMFNKYLDMCKKAETGQEKIRKTSEKQVGHEFKI